MIKKLIIGLVFLLVLYGHYWLVTGKTSIDINWSDNKAVSKKAKIKKKKLRLSDLSSGLDEFKDKKKFVPSKHIYCLPYKPGNTYPVSQTEGFSHKGASKHAIDFVIPENGGVYAARAGVVMDAVGGFRDSGRTQEYLSRANYIVVKHSDGSMAMYAHLAHKGVKVRRGDRIEVGDQIGFSGSTGYSNGAHLHFEVFHGFSQDYQSYPVSFKTANSLKEKLIAGKSYRAVKCSF